VSRHAIVANRLHCSRKHFLDCFARVVFLAECPQRDEVQAVSARLVDLVQTSGGDSRACRDDGRHVVRVVPVAKKYR
jgi:hypothetical protein